MHKKNPLIFEGLSGGQYFFFVLIHCTANPFSVKIWRTCATHKFKAQKGPSTRDVGNLKGRGVKIFWNLPTDMSKKSADMGEEKAWGGGCQIWYYQLGSFKTRDTKDFGIKINIPKGNCWILRIGLMGSLSSLQKSEVLKLIILIFHV